MALEHERRFLVNGCALPTYEWWKVKHRTGPGGALEEERTHIEQVYLAQSDGTSVRVRKSRFLFAGNPIKYELTVKGPGTVTRAEHTLLLQEAVARPLMEGKHALRKIRTIYQGPDGIRLEVDEFEDGLRGLILMEVEADLEVLGGYDPPLFCEREVTEDPRYTNAALWALGPALEHFRRDWLR